MRNHQAIDKAWHILVNSAKRKSSMKNYTGFTPNYFQHKLVQPINF